MNDDLISRAAALEVLSIVCYYNGDFLKEGLGMLAKPSEVAHRLRRVPAVDAVEIVRCKDCKHRGLVGECPMCFVEDVYDEDFGYEYWDVDKTVDEGFCHCGEPWGDAEVEG